MIVIIVFDQLRNRNFIHRTLLKDCYWLSYLKITLCYSITFIGV